MMLRSLAPLPLVLFVAAGSAVPPPSTFDCEVPIRWYIAEIDERFGLDAEAAARAVRQAGLLWQEAVGHRLLFQESEVGMAIRFVYDERQDTTAELRRLESEAVRLEREVNDARAELEEAREALAERRRTYESRSASFRDRLTNHNRQVDDWNREGGAPADELRRLRIREEALERERGELNVEVGELNTMIAAVNERAARMNEMVAEHDRMLATIEERFPEGEGDMVSGRYREVRRLFSVAREIEIYQFEDPDHLVLVLAHELGHALGLEHSTAPDAVMAESRVTRPGAGPPRLHRADVAQIRELCFPVLGG